MTDDRDHVPPPKGGGILGSLPLGGRGPVPVPPFTAPQPQPLEPLEHYVGRLVAELERHVRAVLDREPAVSSRSAIGRRTAEAQRAAATAVDVAARELDHRLELSRRVDELVAAGEHTCTALESALDRLDLLELELAAVRSSAGRRQARRYFRALRMFRP